MRNGISAIHVGGWYWVSDQKDIASSPWHFRKAVNLEKVYEIRLSVVICSSEQVSRALLEATSHVGLL